VQLWKVGMVEFWNNGKMEFSF